MATSSFQSALQQEVARLVGSGKAQVPDPRPAGNAEASMSEVVEEGTDADQLRKQRTKLDAIVGKLESVDHDSVKQILEERRAERTSIREKLRALKPLPVQIRQATEARGMALKHHVALTMELVDLKQLVLAKERLAAESVREADANQIQVDELVERHMQEHAMCLTAHAAASIQCGDTAAPTAAVMPTAKSPVQWMAGLASALQDAPEVAASFQQWLGSVQAERDKLGVGWRISRFLLPS
mmetsp:Transcript_22786/g.58122  ORF Transcript_22786/g.58122 Transcript_22786/m.58122 type:complete len:241 (+) Transcript_22786:520-1242(+)